MARFADRIGPKDFGEMPGAYRPLLTRLLTIQADKMETHLRDTALRA